MEASIFSGTNATFIAELYQRYLDDPNAVDQSWVGVFRELMDDPDALAREVSGPSWDRGARKVIGAPDPDAPPAPAKKKGDGAAAPAAGAGVSEAEVRLRVLDSIRALMMIRVFRVRGHLQAALDPLGLVDPTPHPELDYRTYGFTDADLDREIFIDNVLGLGEKASLRKILSVLKKTYCGSIGVEFMHIQDPDQKAWIQQRMEGSRNITEFTDLGKKTILERLTEAEGFERFLQIKYTGTKRFGLEGGESVIPAIEQVLKRGSQLGVEEVVFGMAHRGRLNVLANILHKPYRNIFSEFQGNAANPDDVQGSGDVKYHLGTSADRDFDGKTVHLSLQANPSHLEAVDPVVLGKVRARQGQLNDTERTRVLAVILHGDAAFAGQGLVPECLGLSQLKGYRTGGTIHFIINNQIGFTTNPRYSRSSPYCTDVAKMVEAPIFHVNGDDPEAVVHVAKIATEFRQKFQKPVVIDMVCYRRYGHNEADEPMFTQPRMYRKIKQHTPVATRYAERLIEERVLSEREVDEMREGFRAHLESEFTAADNYKPNKADWLDGRWSSIGFAEDEARRGNTGVELAILRDIGKRITKVPGDFNTHKTVKRLLDRRAEMIETGVDLDWAMCEHLAFGSLLAEGFPVRLSGQDSERGTFSQRHSVLTDQETERRFTPLRHISPDQAGFEVINSMLSEEAVLGFEYGYSLAEPNALVLWEAQFGDFANGAQVIFDQFVSSGERKWLRMSGLVCLLPHGYEGQGPEHSSARLERYLQLCAEDNWQIANCTTPANYFHILRRQIHRKFRKPLVLMTPKSLLRHKRVVSRLEEIGPDTSFHRVLWDDADGQHKKPTSDFNLKPDSEIKRIVMCSGKVYYDLMEERGSAGLDDVYIFRIEQLYPFPARTLIQELVRFENVAEYVWCQEEPKNMGAWTFIEPNIEWVLDHIGAKKTRAEYAGRPASASTATGLLSRHLSEQKTLVQEALTA